MQPLANHDMEAVLDTIRERIRQDPEQMTMQLARELGVPEEAVVRAFPKERVQELDATCWEAILHSLEGLGKLHVIVSNAAATLEAVGEFGGFTRFEPFFNIQTASLDMHIHWRNLHAIFAVEKPSHLQDISTYSIQFFDDRGAAAFKVFLNFGGKITAQRKSYFDELRRRFIKET